ncbi:MAG: Rieske 2Fe-2S domain-containing protein [Candidatus Binataceae bacterium]
MKHAYGGETPRENASLTHVGPGTPMGELLRRYWQPVCLSDELAGLPRRTRILGEDLIAFRDNRGRAGLLELHCSHRGTSLEWGRIEEGGIRCCYHGWLYDIDGRVLEMPCEAADYPARRKIEHPAYPVIEYGGLAFTYMGPPEKQPLFPMYDIIDTRGRDDVAIRGVRIWKDCFIGYVRDCNWLQSIENAIDPWHLYALHTMISGAQFQGVLGALDKPFIDFEETSLGARYHLERVLPSGNRLIRYGEIAVPNIILIPNIHERGAIPLERDKPSEVTWALPIDDTHLTGLSLVAWPLRNGEPDPEWRPRTDTIIPERPGGERERAYEDRQRMPDDREAQEGQRPIAIHALENLVSSDRGVVMWRRKLLKSLELIAAGKDPLNIVRDPEKNHAIETNAWNSVVAGISARAAGS